MAARLAWVSPVVLPCALSAGYLALLITRFPRLVRWESADSDIVSAFTLTEAIAGGHTGPVVLSTQGSWVPLAFGLLTHGLSFHRLLWEISPMLVSLASALVIGWAVSRVAGRAAAALTVAMVVAASPTVLANFSAAFFHNTTIIGAAILDAYLVWLAARTRSREAVAASAVVLSVVIGTFLASDALLFVDGLIPFTGAVLLLAWRRSDRRGLAPVLGVTAGALVVRALTAALASSQGLITTTPAVRLMRDQIGVHAGWLVDGLLRLGGGLRTAPGGPPEPLLVGAAVAMTAAIVVTLVTAARGLGRVPARELGGACSLHTCFWAGSLVCVSLAYVLTTVAVEPSDRYLVIAIPAVAAVVPLHINRARVRSLIGAGAMVLALTNLVALADDLERTVIRQGPAVAVLGRIESVVRVERLGVGYAGYWDAAALTWSSGGRLPVYPITDVSGRTAPMFLARVSSWYQPRKRTPSYIILAPADADLADRLPPGLPRPRREIHLGAITLAVYPNDVARYLAAPLTP